MSEQRILIVLDDFFGGAKPRDLADAQNMHLIDYEQLHHARHHLVASTDAEWSRRMRLHLTAGDSIYCRGYPGVPKKLATDAEVLADALDRFRDYDVVISVEPRDARGPRSHIPLSGALIQSFPLG